MRFLVVNNVRGDFRYLTQQIRNNNPDFVILTGMTGVKYKNKGDNYLLDFHWKLSDYDREYIEFGDSDFGKVLNRQIQLDVPVYILNYICDNGYLFNKLRNRQLEYGERKINNLHLMDSGARHIYDKCLFAGLGGTFVDIEKHPSDKYLVSHNGFTINHIKTLLSHPQIDFLFLNEPFGGRGSPWNLMDSYMIDGQAYNLYDVVHKLNTKVVFFGGDIRIVGDDYIHFTDKDSNERTFCWCRSMKEVCYLYDTEMEQIIYV